MKAVIHKKIKAIKKIRIQRTVNKVIDTIDLDKFGILKTKYGDISPSPGFSKYLDLEQWLEKNLQYVFSLNLHRSKPSHILDIGAGCGYFLYLCHFFNHSVMALDLDETPLYNEMIALLDIPRTVWQIRAYEKLPVCETKFDLITTFAVCFNNHNQPDLWGVDEWRFFLYDLATTHLNKNGRVFLKLNQERNQANIDEHLAGFFTDHGAQIHGWEVYFPSGIKVPETQGNPI